LDGNLQDELRKEGTAFDIMIVVVAKEYQGKGLSQLLIAESEKLGCAKGFRYSYCQASNFKTAKSLMRQGYSKLIEIDLGEFVV
jgi:GNAT superfamily N-acetyltransferase